MIKYLLIIATIFLLTACSSKSDKLSSKCYTVPKTGNCKAMINKYYFNIEDKSCKSFIWGGCGGNIPFQTLEECKKTCE